MKCYIKVPIPRFPENGVISPSPSAPCARSMFGTSRFTHFAAARFIFSLKLSRSAMGVPRLRPEERQRMQRHGDDPGYSRVKHGETDHFFNKVGLFISLHTLHIVIFHFRANKVTPYIRDAIALAELINICNVCACVYINVSCVYINHHFALLCQLQPSQQPAPPPPVEPLVEPPDAADNQHSACWAARPTAARGFASWDHPSGGVYGDTANSIWFHQW